MSTYMYVVTEKDYLQFLKDIKNLVSYDAIYNKFDAINYEINFFRVIVSFVRRRL